MCVRVCIDMLVLIQPARASVAYFSQAGKIFLSHGASACTDVTGFGFVGHLNEMLSSASVSAHLWLDHVPLLPGAEDCISKGIFSSMYPSNVRARHLVDAPEALRTSPRYPLLFDPQTSGGLLAGISAARAEACLAELTREGYVGAAIVGCVVERDQAPISVLPARP
jgi:selenide,water dikinase